MRPLTRLAALGLLLALAAPSPAGKFNKTLSIGDKAPAWENLDGVVRYRWLTPLVSRPIVMVGLNVAPNISELRVNGYPRNWLELDDERAENAMHLLMDAKGRK